MHPGIFWGNLTQLKWLVIANQESINWVICYIVNIRTGPGPVLSLFGLKDRKTGPFKKARTVDTLVQSRLMYLVLANKFQLSLTTFVIHFSKCNFNAVLFSIFIIFPTVPPWIMDFTVVWFPFFPIRLQFRRNFGPGIFPYEIALILHVAEADPVIGDSGSDAAMLELVYFE